MMRILFALLAVAGGVAATTQAILGESLHGSGAGRARVGPAP